MSVLQSLQDGLLRLSQLERRVDPFFRPLFDALFREQLARVVQRLISARRKRDALRIGEQRESPLRPHRLRADVVELGRVAIADGPGAQDEDALQVGALRYLSLSSSFVRVRERRPKMRHASYFQFPYSRTRIMEQEHAIGWGTLALLNAGLARCMNRDGFGWFSLSIFTGPVATLVLVILGPVAPKRETETKDRPNRNRGDEGLPL